MASHTATGEWQSFEIRMRQRRAARLLARADAALAEGALEEARACVDELRALVPDSPDAARVQTRLAGLEPAGAVTLVAPVTPSVPSRRERPVVSPPAVSSRGERSFRLAAVALVAVIAVLPIAWPQISRVTTAAPRPNTTHLATPAPPLPRPPMAEPASFTPARQPEPATAALESPVRSEPAAPLPAVSTAPPPEPVADTPKASVASVAPPEPREERPVPVPPIPLTALSDAPAAAPAPAIEPPPAEPPQEPRIQAVLNRYAVAYSDLDADAAQRVWPSVNRDALSRAFDGLASQRVTLDACRIDVAGAKAQATCDGTTTWTPKVGAGGRTESRTWTFALERDGTAWQIVSARVQNR